MSQRDEPKEAFPYRPPTDDIKYKFRHIFDLEDPLPQRAMKIVVDKVVAFLVLVVALPVFLLMKIAYVVEGIIVPDNAGPLFYFYYAVSAGKVFPKYKIRLIKQKCIDPEGATRHEWQAYASEWKEECRTFVGRFVKRFYLDELTQFYNILRGDMTIVGPRPLSLLHYHRDLEQGNVARKLLKGGLLGLGHIHKGTPEMGNPVYEYEYVDQYLKRSALGLLLLDLWIMWKGLLLVLKGGGH